MEAITNEGEGSFNNLLGAVAPHLYRPCKLQARVSALRVRAVFCGYRTRICLFLGFVLIYYGHVVHRGNQLHCHLSTVFRHPKIFLPPQEQDMDHLELVEGPKGLSTFS
jgi:hypothetical protein